MPLDGKLLVQAKAALDKKRREKSEMYARRQLEVYGKAPIVRTLDEELKATMLELASVSLGLGSARKIEDIRIQNVDLQDKRYAEIVQAGFPADYLDEGYMCSKCRDTGYEGAKICDCLMKLYKKEQTESLSSLLKLGDETFDSFDLSYYDDALPSDTGVSPRRAMEMIYEICVEYSRKFGAKSMNLFFSGAPGLGKTFLSACIARVVSDKGYSVVYDMAASVFAKYEDAKFGRSDDPDRAEETRSEIKRYQECDLLILDDLGTEMTTAFTISALYELINTRLITNKKTLVSSNLTVGDLHTRYPKQITSRLEGEYQMLTFRGEDIRKKKNRV